MRRGRTKRQFLRGIGVTGAVSIGALQAACAPGSGGIAGEGGQKRDAGPAKIAYLRYYNQPDRVQAEQTVFKRLQDQRPGLTIEELTVAGTNEMIQQMTASYAAGTAPDTWTTAPTIYHEYVKSGSLLQIDDLIKKDIDPKKHFMETMSEWESPAATGKHFGLTRDFVVTILYYNRNLFDAARVPYPDANWTYDTLLSHAPKFVKQQDSAELSEWAFLAGAGHDNFDAVARANGGLILNKQRTRAVMDGSPQTAATLEQWMAMNQQTRLSPPPSHPFWQSFQGLTLRNPFFTGRVAMHQALTGLISQLRVANNTLLQWGVAPVPKGKAKHDAYGGPDGQVISKSSKHPDICWQLMLAFLTPESLPFHLAWGGIPFSRQITTLPAWRDQEPKGHTQVLLDSAKFFAAEFNMNYSQWQAPKRTAINKALDGALGSREALRQATEESNKVLADVYPQA
jgi:multiple sugar transport system substrate-binding protein